MTSLLCIGECMVEMAVTGDGTFRLGFAGDTFNTAWHARKVLGAAAEVNYFSAVGDDAMSARMVAFMAEQNIGTKFIAHRKTMRCGLYTIELNNGERSFTYWRDTSAARTLADDSAALETAIDQNDAIYFSGITLAILEGKKRTTFLELMAKAKSAGKRVAFDSNLRPKLWPDKSTMKAAIVAAAKTATLALPTIPDETDLFEETTAKAVAERYCGCGVGEIVIKAGADPAQLFWPNGTANVAAVPVNPRDTTGAGDSFNGAYIASRMLGKSPVESAEIAHVRAAKVIQQFGALDLA